MTTMTVTPAIWVADLAAYNAGNLHGEWIRLGPETTRDELELFVSGILASGTRMYGAETLSEKHEEFAIFDYEGFGPLRLGEYASLETVLEHVNRIGDDPERYFAFIDAVGEQYADQYEAEDVTGPYDSEADYAWEQLDCYLGGEDLDGWLTARGLPEHLRQGLRFDAEAFNYALRCNSSMTFGRSGGRVYAIETR